MATAAQIARQRAKNSGARYRNSKGAPAAGSGVDEIVTTSYDWRLGGSVPRRRTVVDRERQAWLDYARKAGVDVSGVGGMDAKKWRESVTRGETPAALTAYDRDQMRTKIKDAHDQRVRTLTDTYKRLKDRAKEFDDVYGAYKSWEDIKAEGQAKAARLRKGVLDAAGAPSDFGSGGGDGNGGGAGAAGFRGRRDSVAWSTTFNPDGTTVHKEWPIGPNGGGYAAGAASGAAGAASMGTYERGRMEAYQRAQEQKMRAQEANDKYDYYKKHPEMYQRERLEQQMRRIQGQQLRDISNQMRFYADAKDAGVDLGNRELTEEQFKAEAAKRSQQAAEGGGQAGAAFTYASDADKALAGDLRSKVLDGSMTLAEAEDAFRGTQTGQLQEQRGQVTVNDPEYGRRMRAEAEARQEARTPLNPVRNPEEFKYETSPLRGPMSTDPQERARFFDSVQSQRRSTVEKMMSDPLFATLMTDNWSGPAGTFRYNRERDGEWTV